MRSLYKKLIVPLVAATAFGVSGCGNSDEEILRKQVEEYRIRHVLDANRVDSLNGVISGLKDGQPAKLESLSGELALRDSLIDTLNVLNEEYSTRTDSLNKVVEQKDSVIADLNEKIGVTPETVVAASAAETKSKWVYNNDYSFGEFGEPKDNRVDFFEVQKGNTIAGGILELAKREGASLTPRQAEDLADKVSVYRNGKQVDVDPTRIWAGDVVQFSDEVQDAIYGPLEQRVNGQSDKNLMSEILRDLRGQTWDGLTTADLDCDGLIGIKDRDLYVIAFHDIKAADLTDCRDVETGTEVNTIDFYKFISLSDQEGLIDIRDRAFADGYNKWKSGKLCGEETPKADEIGRNLLSAYKLSTDFFDGGASYDRILGNGFGIGAEVGRSNDNLRALGRVSYGNDDFRAGVGLGNTYLDNKKAVTIEPYFQFQVPHFATDRVYGEAGLGIWDVGRWRDELDGNGFDATKRYGEVKTGIGVRF